MGIIDKLNMPVIQFSPPRTGSTLIWNVLREVFPGRQIKKKHSLRKTRLGPFRFSVVCSVRHPMDALASCIQCRELPLTDQVIDELMADFDRLAIRTILDIRNNPKVLILKYEAFSNNYEYIFSELEQFFNIKIAPEKRRLICEKFDIKKVKNKTEELGDFSNWSAEDHLHGRHISKFNGASGYYNQFFSAEQIEKMSAHYREYMHVFGYKVSTNECGNAPDECH